MRSTFARIVVSGVLLCAASWPSLGLRTMAAEPSARPAAAGTDELGAWLSRDWEIDTLSGLLATAAPSRRWQPYRVNLSPAQWIWLPSERTLPNTFVLFRRELELKTAPQKVLGWITADSRYRLTVNGQLVQWGPAPCDPRQLDVDPVDLTRYLRLGKNVLGVEVLHYGVGDGTWAAGKPGLLFRATIQSPTGASEQVCSDASWRACVDRAHRPGQPKRWFLRALQEEFDARLHPYGWDTPEFQAADRWLAAQPLNCPADKPSSCSGYPGGDSLDQANPAVSSLRTRQIPLVQESAVPALRLSEAGRVAWARDPADWFDFRMPGSFEVRAESVATPQGDGRWQLPATAEANQAVCVTFEFREQVVGWPYFTIDAPAGTIVELLPQESHDPKKTKWLDSHFFAWTRFICREGVNRFQTFDYESLRWLQLHVRQASRPVTISQVGVRRRQFDWPHTPQVRCSDPALQRLFEASVNTLRNSAIETCVDGMGRERQQYSGDGGHQLLAIRYAFGEPRLSRRFLRTFSEGLSPAGYFLDCWPAYDRLARLSQKAIDGAYWGPLLDHGIGFNFDCWSHYLETGDRESLLEPYPRLLRFAEYLKSLRGADGLLPVVDLGMPTVWMDHEAYRQQRHKQCAFNLYAAAMFRHALAPLSETLGDRQLADQHRQFSYELLAATVRRYWSPQHGLFVNNLPWLQEEHAPRLCDRSLATAILFDQCPEGNTAAALQALVECPPHLGLSYPCNAGWRLWALAKLGRGDICLTDFRKRWATMRSVIENNTLQEGWTAEPDSTAQWSHCAVVPLYILYQDLAGIRPTAPGFAKIQIRPQLGDLDQLELTAFTVRGPIQFAAQAQAHGHRVQVTLPRDCEVELLAPAGSTAAAEPLTPDHPSGLKRFRLRAGELNTCQVARPATK